MPEIPYFSSIDREHHLIMMGVDNYLSEWVALSTKRLEKEELRYIRTGLTWLRKAAVLITNRMSKQYRTSLLNDAKRFTMSLEDKSTQTEPTATLLKDDLYDIISVALRGCDGCTKRNWQNCRCRRIFIEQGIEELNTEKDQCEYTF